MFGLSYQEIVDLTGYIKIIGLAILTIVFYSYAYSIYKRDKAGERDYEKYSKLVLDDDINSTPLESRENSKKEK